MRRSATVELPAPDRVEMLRSTLIFRGLEPVALDALAQLGRWVRVPAGAVMFRENEQGAEMYVIALGTLALQKEGADGPRFLANRTRGDVVGEMSLLDGRPRSASGICETDCLLLAIRQSEFVQCLKRHPEVAMGIVANLLDRLREADERATADAGLDVLGRLSKFLLNECQISSGKPWVRPKPADRVIAEKIGCSRETVNRKLSELEGMRAVERRKEGIAILDEDRLAEIANEM